MGIGGNILAAGRELSAILLHRGTHASGLHQDAPVNSTLGVFTLRSQPLLYDRESSLECLFPGLTSPLAFPDGLTTVFQFPGA